MKICFVGLHKYWGGLANGGGSKTIIKSAEVLRKLGYRVDIAAVNDRHTWVKHPPIIHKIPKDTDVAIANSVSDIDIVLKSKAKRKFWWARGIETWQMPLNRIKKKAKKINVIVNASHLLEYFPHGNLCYAGLDLDYWEDKNKPNSSYCWIGSLYSKQHNTKRYDLFKKLQKDLHGKGKYVYTTLKNNKNDEELKHLYKFCAIWFAPTELEGFHNVPAEANLCGCLVICNRMSTNGMGDYAAEETAMRFSSWNECLAAIKNPDFSKVKKMQKVLREKIGSREKNMKRFVGLIK